MAENQIERSLKEILKIAKAQREGKVRRLMETVNKNYWIKNHDESTDIDTPKEYEIFKRDIIEEGKYKITDRLVL